MTNIKTLLLSGLLLIIFLGCKYLDVNKKKVINEYFAELKNDVNNDSLYKKYFYKEKNGEEGRSPKDIKIYTDSLFEDIQGKVVGKSILILSLKEAKIRYPNYNFLSNYYDAQYKNIYVCIIEEKLLKENILYILMYGDKIISLLPIKTIDGKVIQWF